MEVSNGERNATFGIALRAERKKKGLSLDTFSAQAKLDKSYLSRMENGHIPPMSNDSILFCGASCGFDTDVLFLAARRVPPDVLEIVLNGGLDLWGELRDRSNEK